MTIKVLIADDHAVVRDGLQMILTSADLLVVGTASNGREAVARAAELRPDVVIMDIAMPVLNGIEAAAELRDVLPPARVIMLSMYNTREHVYRAVQAGARAYLLKESAGAEVAQAIRTVMQGGRYFGANVETPSGRDRDRPQSPLERLSSREREVLQLVVEGKTSAEIARDLSLSPKSVETYRSRLMSKLGVGNITGLVKFALLHGITPPR